MSSNPNIRVMKDSNEEYHSKSQYISSSQVKTICKKSVTHFIEQEAIFGPALTIGSAFHGLVLEPEIFDKEFLVLHDKIDRRTKAGKQKHAMMEKIAIENGQELILKDDFLTIQRMARSVENNAEYTELLDNCKKEISIYIDDFQIPGLDHKFQVRVRPDAYSGSPMNFAGKTIPNVVCDLKSCQDSSPRAFKSSIYMYGWHIQAAYYLDLLTHVSKSLFGDDGVPFDTFYFLAVEKKHPYMAQMYELNKDMLEEGRRQYRKALRMWHTYLETNISTGFHVGTEGPSSLLVL